jgi:acetylornithine/N-succinyldiaminopimelate aminotransferase
MFDMACGIAVNNLGHNNKAILTNVKRTVDKYAHINVYGEMNIKEQLKYAELLAEEIQIFGNPEKKVWFCTSGTEANELAMKLALLSTRKRGFIALENGFHGRSLGSLSLTHKPTYRAPFTHMVNRELTKWVVPGEEISADYASRAALFLELIQGEAGVVPLDPEWVQYVRNWCTENEVLLVIDEVQTGFGRTGTQFAQTQYNVEPDIMTLGKALGGGYPLGAVVASSERFRSMSHDNPFTHLSTFGGNPISVAAGAAMFRETKKVALLQKVNDGNILAHRAFEDFEYASLRGKGLMLGLVLNDDIDIDTVVQNIWKNGVFCGRVLYGSNTIRLYPPLNATRSDVYNKMLRVRDAVELSIR